MARYSSLEDRVREATARARKVHSELRKSKDERGFSLLVEYLEIIRDEQILKLAHAQNLDVTKIQGKIEMLDTLLVNIHTEVSAKEKGDSVSDRSSSKVTKTQKNYRRRSINYDAGIAN